MVLTDDGGWQCRPRFPTYFGGADGTEMTSCNFNPSVHKGPARKSYKDVTSSRRILSHRSFPECTYLRIIRSAKTVSTFKALARDPDLLFKFPVTCECSGKRDVLNNRLMSEDITRTMKFRGLYECLENPCVMVPMVDEQFVTFDPAEGTCNPTHMTPIDTVNAIMGDNRTPLVGQVPAMGLILADPEKRADRVQRSEISHDEATAKKVTRAAAPVVTATNLDTSNSTRNVLFVPVPSMVLPPVTVTMRPSSLLHMECLPPLLNRRLNQYRPFCTTPFYVEPAANVLAGHVPQKPYEHNMLVTECLRNSRMISGNVLGGSELLYSTLLSHDSGEGTLPAPRTPGDDRIEEIRDYFDRNFNGGRRLSNTEYLMRKRNLTADRIFHGFSKWDSEFRKRDYDNIGIHHVSESFVLKEGLLLRSYGPYAATVLAFNSFEFDYMKGRATETASALKPFNPLQFAFPTSHSLLPEEKSPEDIFSVDRTRIFRSGTIERYFDAKSGGNGKLFSDDVTSPMSHYRVDSDNDAWGLQTFRLDLNPRKGPVIVSDPRMEFDTASINVTPTGATITPLSLFKKTPLEWGHREADMQRSSWFRSGIDTSRAYRRILAETDMAVRNTWFSLAWETKHYYFVKSSV